MEGFWGHGRTIIRKGKTELTPVMSAINVGIINRSKNINLGVLEYSSFNIIRECNCRNALVFWNYHHSADFRSIGVVGWNVGYCISDAAINRTDQSRSLPDIFDGHGNRSEVSGSDKSIIEDFYKYPYPFVIFPCFLHFYQLPMQYRQLIFRRSLGIGKFAFHRDALTVESPPFLQGQFHIIARTQ
jgi:hypothetical protein